MNRLTQILEHNKRFVTDPTYRQSSFREEKISKYPAKRLGILTCMDTRLVEFLEPALGIGRGEAKIIKNAGNTVTHLFDGVVRSFLVAIYELGVEELMVVGHDDCGMEHTTADSLIRHMTERGIEEKALAKIKQDLVEWADYFHHPEANVRHTVSLLKENPYIPKEIPIHGLIINPKDGKLRLLVNGYEA